jgi:hypothetical protein
MLIQLKNFGTTLTSRQLGKEAFSGFAPNLDNVLEGEVVMVDFEGVDTFSPSWGDEFLTQMYNRFKKKLLLKNTKNPSVLATINILEETNEIKFEIEK